ncbi:MAG TPA: hypothetical protein VEZ41_07775 [Allosphingosinicella sp.]|nr:hypothetical protein [Allosphingosinicella sp.]
MASVAEAAAPAGLAEVKALLRIGSNGEDALIAGFLETALASCEAFTGRALIAREVREVVAASGAWVRLATAPVQAIAGVASVAADGSESAVAVPAYAVDIDAAGEGWVRVAHGNGVKRAAVRFTAGMAADWDGVPEPLRQGVVRLAAHLYGARGEFAAMPPAAVSALWRPWRRVRLG